MFLAIFVEPTVKTGLCIMGGTLIQLVQFLLHGCYPIICNGPYFSANFYDSRSLCKDRKIGLIRRQRRLRKGGNQGCRCFFYDLNAGENGATGYPN